MPPTNPIIQLLRGVELFQGLPPIVITEIARRAMPVAYRPGERLVHTGDRVNGSILIRSGQAVCSSGDGAVSGEVLVPGSLIHEMGMFVEMESGATIIARTQVTALALSRQMMLSFLEEEPRFCDHFNVKISARVASIAAELRKIDQSLALHSSDRPTLSSR